MSKLILIDIGSSNIDIGISSAGEIVSKFYISADKKKTEYDYYPLLRSLFERSGVETADISGAALSSVVPELTSRIKAAVRLLFGDDIKIVTVGAGVKTGLNLRTDIPSEVGSDIVACCVSTAERYSLPAVVVDFGTATVFSLVDENKCFRGCSILSGIGPSLHSLSELTESLPGVELGAPARVIGKNTVESIRSGAVYGAAATFDGMIDKIEKENGEIKSVIVTGRTFEYIKDSVAHDYIFDPDLLLHGLGIIFEKNK